MPSLRVSAVVFGAFLVTMIGLAAIGNIIAPHVPSPERLRLPSLIVFFVLFLGTGFSAIPVMVHIVLGGLPGGLGATNPMRRLGTITLWGIWALCAAGLVVALPAAIADGFFGSGPAREVTRRFEGPSRGTLTANVGMTIDEIKKRSTLAVTERAWYGGTREIIGDPVFDFHLAGTPLTFPRSRFYVAMTAPHDRHVVSLEVGISPDALPHGEALAAERDTAARLQRAGWRRGDSALGTTTWTKGDAVLQLGIKRVDDSGQSAEPGGRWIQTFSLTRAPGHRQSRA